MRQTHRMHALGISNAQMDATVPPQWPRGFPLEAIKDPRTRTANFARRAWPARRLGVIQSLADHDPDVDGIYRLTQPLPFSFPSSSAMSSGRRLLEARSENTFNGRRVSKLGRTGGSASKGGAHKGAGLHVEHPKAGTYHHIVSLRAGTMMPYNAQATLHSYDAFWGLLLPCTVHGRVTDIWRAYFTQRMLWDVGLRIGFSSPWVTQYRNAHNYLAGVHVTPLHASVHS